MPLGSARSLVAIVLLGAGPAHAHLGGGAGDPWWHHLDPLTALLLLVSATLHARGRLALAARSRRGGREQQRLARRFQLGLMLLALAVLSPLDAWGEQLFSAHMVQHELLILGAAPLLVSARPLPVLMWGLPARWRAALARGGRHAAWRAPWRVLSAPLVAWALHAATLWQWHLPTLFEAALNDPLVHGLQHMGFFGSALLFWWSLLGSGARIARPGIGVIAVFTTALHSSLLGALLSFSPSVWYPSYLATAPRWGLTALQDQQIGGLIMWVPAGLVFIGIGLMLLEQWLRQPPPEPEPARLPPWQRP
ncbi:MAG: cytochrome c oxidase assembly protein [Hydrogenophaga sp.]|uniref:cytochrome c oxidase assembly protein n=1 Tax=Hydrogenophaga sp. TaxID=1904254 RepID=UPI0016A06BD6|nr:cytochrome c oxidase assembly protein [Hydrogenophaga sp.]NIM39876.1 cytochrome c oxidase assembly protein [Hydrogenophaga sp.]NIN25072.1 cytochrome c oxidase assembly protein [Hydrogenophaga sp.]NIN29639.1 cytochrome c oxidase assembly protein [Hydrogenophaga sp.]NIN54111.1 cytochrome c oxidase assembly protein [Hydrogenophaga sp.]NIO50524.1 cytochrome c oxidase assembly protein [Hydrogenophaga sp.]